MGEIFNGVWHGKGVGFEKLDIDLTVATTNDANIDMYSFLVITNTHGVGATLTGLFMPEEPEDGIIHQVRMLNISANDVTLANNNVGSTSGWRFLNSTGGDVTLAQGVIKEYYLLRESGYNGWVDEV